MAQNYEVRYATHPADAKAYDTERIRKEFLVENIMVSDEIKMVYSLYDRYIVGGAVPVNQGLKLEPIDPLKAGFFLERREMGIINVGGAGLISVDGKDYQLNYKDALYIGRGYKEILLNKESLL